MPPVIVEPSPLQSNPLGNTDDYAFQGKPSKRGGQRRTLYYAVKIGHTPGVYESWDEAERSIKAHAAPQWKTFKTYAAAEAFVAGRDGGSFRVTHVSMAGQVIGV
jgi:viroplasmin and RNaseH domain-containing protein